MNLILCHFLGARLRFRMYGCVSVCLSVCLLHYLLMLCTLCGERIKLGKAGRADRPTRPPVLHPTCVFKSPAFFVVVVLWPQRRVQGLRDDADVRSLDHHGHRGFGAYGPH